MNEVNVTELRANLPSYLEQVQRGREVKITRRGKVVARIVPEEDESQRAKRTLFELRKTAKIGDLTSPSGAVWNAELGII